MSLLKQEVKNDIDRQSAEIEAIVAEIVKPYTGNLTLHINELKEMASQQDFRDMSITELTKSLLFISTSLYSLAGNMEKTALKQAVAATVRNTKYNDFYGKLAEGTIADKKAMAESHVLDEQLVEFVYKSAYNRLKNLFEAGNELHSSLKKIVNLKNSEMQLSMKVSV